MKITRKQIKKLILEIAMQSSGWHKFIQAPDSSKILVMGIPSLFETFYASLAQADEDGATGYGQLFETVAAAAIPRADVNNDFSTGFTALNSGGNFPFADLYLQRAALNTAYTVKFSRSVGNESLSGIKYDQIPQALVSLYKSVPSLSTFGMGLIKGSYDYSYINEVGHLGIPVQITVVDPTPGSTLFKLTGRKGSKQYFITKPSDTLVTKYNLAAREKRALFNNLGKPNIADVSSSEITSVEKFKEYILNEVGNIYKIKVLLTDITDAQTFDDALALFQTSNKDDNLTKRTADNVRFLLGSALTSTIQLDVKATRAMTSWPRLKGAMGTLIGVMTQSEFYSNPYIQGSKCFSINSSPAGVLSMVMGLKKDSPETDHTKYTKVSRPFAGEAAIQATCEHYVIMFNSRLAQLISAPYSSTTSPTPQLLALHRGYYLAINAYNRANRVYFQYESASAEMEAWADKIDKIKADLVALGFTGRLLERMDIGQDYTFDIESILSDPDQDSSLLGFAMIADGYKSLLEINALLRSSDNPALIEKGYRLVIEQLGGTLPDTQAPNNIDSINTVDMTYYDDIEDEESESDELEGEDEEVLYEAIVEQLLKLTK